MHLGRRTPCVLLCTFLAGASALSGGCEGERRRAASRREPQHTSPAPGPDDVSAMVFARAIAAGEPADLTLSAGALRPIAASTSVMCGVQYVAYEDSGSDLVFIKQMEGFTGRESWFACRRCCWESAF